MHGSIPDALRRTFVRLLNPWCCPAGHSLSKARRQSFSKICLRVTRMESFWMLTTKISCTNYYIAIRMQIKRLVQESELFSETNHQIIPQACFHALRADGSSTDFGYSACVTGRAPSLRHDFYEACRRSGVAELMDQKQQLFDSSPGTGELTTIHTSEYRHTEPRFRDIVTGFIQGKNLVISSSMVTESQDMQYQTVFTSPAMALDFIECHATVAKLEIFKKYVL
ncbi:hypothetical protein ACVWZP_004121 [Pseudomonas sp. TE36184]